ncbi:MAG: hypothetical protein U0232_30240 [Thermomicrobiales bacterium]
MDVRLVAVPELARLCHDETTKYLRREPSRSTTSSSAPLTASRSAACSSPATAAPSPPVPT